jgi:hypothetical protein
LVLLTAVLLGLLAVPALNILATPDREPIQWTEKSFLYNMDFASRWAALLLYPLGISTNPKQVIIGHDGWLFLGDQYEQTLTIDRSPSTQADFAVGQSIGSATQAWNLYLVSKGVKVFKVMIGPNKATIYPEHLPTWAKPSSPNAFDALLAGTGTAHHLDLRALLLAAKASQPAPLYHKTDTHWNALGAGVAFQALAQQVGEAAPEIQWPTPKSYELIRLESQPGGDLAKFLRLQSYLSETNPIVQATRLTVETSQVDFDTGLVLKKGGNPLIDSSTKPLLVQSAGALNTKKVLWLRDSFGTALSPLMAATFSDVVQLHWIEGIKPNGRLVQLVEDWQPDYVFVTVVERAARSPLFTALPPPVFVPWSDEFRPNRTTSQRASNHLLKGPSAGEFEIAGNDAHIDFTLSETVNPKQARYLDLDLTCADSSTSVQVQLFWLEDGQAQYDEEHSTRFSFRTGHHLIDLRTLPKWDAAKSIRRIRLDMDAQNPCTNFILKNPSLGLLPPAAKSR